VSKVQKASYGGSGGKNIHPVQALWQMDIFSEKTLELTFGYLDRYNINMSMLSDIEIQKAIDSHDIEIKPFDSGALEPASYDFKVGRVLLAGKGIVDPKKEKVVLRTGDWAEIETLESIKLSESYAATYGIRSSVTRRGIDWFGGPQIDPGYGGRIFVSLFNPTSEIFEIEYGEPFCTVIFHALREKASKPYSGKFQQNYTFPEEDVERMLKMKAPTLADVVTSVGTLESTVDELTTKTGQMATDIGWVKKLLFAILIAIVIGITSNLLSP